MLHYWVFVEKDWIQTGPEDLISVSSFGNAARGYDIGFDVACT